MTDAFILDGIRTPIGRFGGSLSPVRADDLAALPIRTLLTRNPKLAADSIEDVILGCANQAGEDNRNVARFAALLGGLPDSVPGQTVNRLCASGLSTAISAAHAIRVGEGDLFITGGVEHMTRSPYVVSKTASPYGRDQQMFDTTMGWRFINPVVAQHWGTDGMGDTAENLVEKFNISREDQDAFALWSQQKALAAIKRGRFAKEIVPVEIPQRKGSPIVFDTDEHPRADTSAEALAKLRPAFKKDGGSVTAGNSSGLNDGACALLIGSQAAAERSGLKPRAKIIASAVVGVEPKIMGIGPVGATRLVLSRSGLSLEQMEVIELNEAFAAQSLACLRELGIPDTDPRLNPNGGAIALGHPLGMSGARLLLTAVHELEEKNARYALCTLCVGVGQGAACILERVG